MHYDHRSSLKDRGLHGYIGDRVGETGRDSGDDRVKLWG